MLGKLIKYELKATSRWFLPIYILALLLAPIERFAIEYIDSNIELNPAFDRITNILFFIITMAFVVALIAIAVASGLLIIYRFYKNLITNEGYLMHTLPVKTSQLIWSKAIAAILWTIASGIVIFLAIILLIIGTPGWREFMSEILKLISTFFQYYGANADVWLLFVEILLAFILGSLSNIFMIYSSISLGQLITKHKILGAFGAYFLLNAALQFISSLLMLPFINKFMDSVDAVDSVPALFSHYLMPIALVYTAILAIIFYFTTSYVFKKKLNLE
ncbi:hypothetical protein [Acetivibrio ethanolgignens]|uniref:Uncharacterized protein n=1 Tax=Acetivibrio ethanolgignens TaxID=290052 RepID=A0A0V8QC15_9FIRM|nr:hypothetical protein [Acetivibrio ethanolgignens]KSV57798.1 hypothetical protein ASU35_14970 [Acetivibrio ethanolgignens]